MVSFENVLDCIVAEPFRPFRLKLASGQVFDVRKPDSIYVRIKSVDMYAAAGTDETAKWHRIPLAQIDALEPLDNATPTLN
jgi:hypothetical protein